MKKILMSLLLILCTMISPPFALDETADISFIIKNTSGVIIPNGALWYTSSTRYPARADCQFTEIAV